MGGHVFGQSSPIRKEHINSTLDKFLNELERIFPKYIECRNNLVTLGSVGKKEISGDIDLGFDEKYLEDISMWDLEAQRINELFVKFKKRARTSTDYQLMKRAVITGISEKINELSELISTDLKGSSSGALYCQFPQYDENNNKLDINVQIDINFGNIEWLKFTYYSDSYPGNI